MSIENNEYNEYNEETNIITLSDENGNDVEFEFLDLIEYNGEEYVVLIPLDDDSVVILKVESEEGSDFEDYVGVESEELLEKLFEIFKENNSDLYNFGD